MLWSLPGNKWISHSTCGDLGERCEWAFKNRTGIDEVSQLDMDLQGSSHSLPCTRKAALTPHGIPFRSLWSKYYFCAISEYYTPAEPGKERKALSFLMMDSKGSAAEPSWGEKTEQQNIVPPLPHYTSNGHLVLVHKILTARVYINTPQIGSTAYVKTLIIIMVPCQPNPTLSFLGDSRNLNSFQFAVRIRWNDNQHFLTCPILPIRCH